MFQIDPWALYTHRMYGVNQIGLHKLPNGHHKVKISFAFCLKALMDRPGEFHLNPTCGRAPTMIM